MEIGCMPKASRKETIARTPEGTGHHKTILVRGATRSFDARAAEQHDMLGNLFDIASKCKRVDMAISDQRQQR